MSKDIDFDELDKAVNSLMGNVTPDTSDEDPKAKTLKINSTLQPGERPAYSRLDEVAKNIGSETLVLDGERTTIEDLDALQLTSTAPANPATETVPTSPIETPLPVRAVPESPKQPLVPKPASGRFMDVVHPSSDMRTAAGDTLPLIVPERNAPAPIEQPIEETLNPQPEKPFQPEIATQVSVPSSEPATTIIEAPLTPFLPDAKVEKRPLGGVISAPEESAVEPSAVPTLEKEDAAPQEEEPTETKSELFKDAPVSEPVAETDQTDPQKEIEAAEATRIPPEAAESIRAVESGDTEKLSAAAQSGGFTVEQLEDIDKSDGAIYDVDNQPQPLGHPAKQKSGWGTVIIILVVIVLSAALGAAAYFILGLGA